MNTLFGLPRTVFALAAIVVAIILVVLVGMIIIGSAAIRALMTPGVKVEGVSLFALLVTIIVLLSAIFVLLLVLLWCCCRHTRGGKDGQLPPNVIAALLPLLPLLPKIRTVISDVAVALYASGKTIGWLHGRMSEAATSIYNVSNDAAHATTIKVQGTTVWPPSWAEVEFNPLGVMVNNLREVVNKLNPVHPPQSDFLELNSANITIADVAQRLEDAGKDLAQIAKALGANPPGELLP